MNKERGSVVIIVSFCIVLFITILAFIVNVGYLSATKNIYENAAEAAAMAGAARLCDGDAIDVAKQIAEENGAPQGSVTVTLGFYDEENEKFYPEGSGDYPEDEYNNAVLVSIQSTENTILGSFLGKEQTQVRAEAVAYAIPYGLLSLGTDSGQGIYTDMQWDDEHPPELQDMGIIYANNEIDFTKPPKLTGVNMVRAINSISNCPEGKLVTEEVHIPPIDWDKLREQAQENGKIITVDDFPSNEHYYDPDDPSTYREDSFGNRYVHDPRGYKLLLKGGDYGGRTYYISTENGNFGIHNEIYVQGQGETYATNLTIASEPNFLFERPMGGYLHLGGKSREDIVRIYCKENIGSPYVGFAQKMEGVIFYTEKDFRYRCSTSHPSPGDEDIQYMRVIAGGSIRLRGYYYAVGLTINGHFGPPCKPCVIRLGRLH